MPGVNVPDVKAPKIPGVKVPGVNVPDVKAPKLPNIIAPDVNVPGVNVPDINAPNINTPNVPGVNLPIIRNIFNTLNINSIDDLSIDKIFNNLSFDKIFDNFNIYDKMLYIKNYINNVTKPTVKSYITDTKKFIEELMPEGDINLLNLRKLFEIDTSKLVRVADGCHNSDFDKFFLKLNKKKFNKYDESINRCMVETTQKKHNTDYKCKATKRKKKKNIVNELLGDTLSDISSHINES